MELLDFDDDLTDDQLAASQIDGPQAEESIAHLLKALGENPERDGLKNTPRRVARMYSELLAGYHMDPVAMINGALFDVKYDEMVIVRDIEFYSMCEHHMLPFMGRVHVAYIPDGKVLGISKIPRVVDMYARRLQVQERMTRQIADFLRDLLKPQGVAVVVEVADHAVRGGPARQLDPPVRPEPVRSAEVDVGVDVTEGTAADVVDDEEL